MIFEKGLARWTKLENAAKIFPSTTNRRDTKVFRFYCELNDAVDPEPLQLALKHTLAKFPFFRSVLKKGLFWYYFEDSQIEPSVHEDNRPPCSQIYNPNRKNLLFDVSYFGCRINLEVYHALTDGTGAMNFLKTLTSEYLVNCHGLGASAVIDYDASEAQKRDDSFSKYYCKPKSSKLKRAAVAYHVNEEKLPVGSLGIIEGRVSAKSLLELSHSLGVTMTAFLCAVLFRSIGDGLSLREHSKPVVISVPVNLRKYFPSESARNFFGVVDVPYNFSEQSGELSEIASYVGAYFKSEFTAEKLGQRFNRLASYERAVAARIAPIPVKNFFMRLAYNQNSRGVTAALSNIGIVKLPEETEKYVRQFGVLCSTARIQACICSYMDNLVISFSSPFLSTDIQRRFFRLLTSMGADVEIKSNIGNGSNL